MINDWNAIDLHMHTCTGVTGDGNSDTILNFTYKNYISALATFNIKLAAITNHNIINIANYLLCRCLGHLQELCVKAHNHVIDAITYLFLPVHEQEERRASALSSSAEGCSSLHPTYR